jgi:hypothetical protein
MTAYSLMTKSGAVTTLALLAVTLATGAHAQHPNGAAAVYSPPVPQAPTYQAPVYRAPAWLAPITGRPAPYMAPLGTPAGTWTYYAPAVTWAVNPDVPGR